MQDINVEKLIKAIKIRPPLYRKKDSLYNNKKHKERLWREVASEVHPNWENLKPVDKVQCVRDTQRRWKSLRTCFTRELAYQRKEREDSPAKKRKKYGYFDALTFLLSEVPEQLDLRESDQESSDPLDPYEDEEAEYNYDSQTEVMNISSIVPEYEIPVYKNAGEFESKVLNVMKGSKSDDDEDDKHFMMSLVPMFRKLTDKQKIKVRIEMMQVVQRSLEETE